MSSEMNPLGVTFGSLGVLGPAAVMDIAKLSADTGYQSLWTVEATGTDAMTLLGAAAASAPGLGLGTGIIPIQLRNPTLTAMTAATMVKLPNKATSVLVPTRNGVRFNLKG